MAKVTEFLFTTKKFGNTYSEINQFLQYLRSEYVDYIDFEIMEMDDLSNIEVYGIREQSEDDLKKCYIVVRESWEYDDERYNQPEDDPYKLHQPKLYTKIEAEELVSKLNDEYGWDDEIWENGGYIDKRIEPYKMIKLQ